MSVLIRFRAQLSVGHSKMLLFGSVKGAGKQRGTG